FQQFAITPNIILFVVGFMRCRSVEVPVLAYISFALGTNGHRVAGHQFLDSGVERFLAREVSECEIFGERGAVEFGTNPAVREQYFAFRSEQETLGSQLVVERLDAEAIARDEEGLRVSV